MRDAKDKKNWQACVLNSVHATISANDALLAKFGSIRSTSQDHVNSADLLKNIIALYFIGN